MLDLNTIPVVIAAGQTVSTTGKLGTQILVGISLPSNFTPAALTFNASPVNDGINFYSLFDESGTAVRMPTTGTLPAGTFVAVSNFDQWAAVNMVQLIASVAQSTAVTITLLVRSASL